MYPLCVRHEIPELDCPSGALVDPDLSCSHNPNLRSLVFGGLQWNSQNMLALPRRLLESIKHPIHHLSVSADLIPFIDVDPVWFDGREMVRILGLPQFAELETLKFYFVGSSIPDDFEFDIPVDEIARGFVSCASPVKEFIEHSLSKFLSNGVLQVSMGELYSPRPSCFVHLGSIRKRRLFGHSLSRFLSSGVLQVSIVSYIYSVLCLLFIRIRERSLLGILFQVISGYQDLPIPRRFRWSNKLLPLLSLPMC